MPHHIRRSPWSNQFGLASVSSQRFQGSLTSAVQNPFDRVRHRTYGSALGCTLKVDRKGSRSQEGTTAMTMLFRSDDAAEIYALEHRFPFATTLISIFMAGNIGSAVLMLIAQA